MCEKPEDTTRGLVCLYSYVLEEKLDPEWLEILARLDKLDARLSFNDEAGGAKPCASL